MKCQILIILGVIMALQLINAPLLNNPNIPLVQPPINYSLIPTVNNSMFLNGFPSSYFYPASNPFGFISSYTETDPFWSGNSSTVARIGTCADGYVVQNTTTSGVQCILRDAPSTTYYVNTSNVTGGTFTDSTLVNSSWYYDELSLNFTEGGGINPLDIYLNYTNVTSFSQLTLREYYLGSASHNMQFQIWDFDTSTWESYYSIVGQSGMTWLQIPVYDSTDHIGTGANLGKVYTRIHHVENGVVSHRMYIDVAWLIDGNTAGSSTNLDGYARYNFGTNNFNGTGNFTTTGNVKSNNIFVDEANTTTSGGWTITDPQINVKNTGGNARGIIDSSGVSSLSIISSSSDANKRHGGFYVFNDEKFHAVSISDAGTILNEAFNWDLASGNVTFLKNLTASHIKSPSTSTSLTLESVETSSDSRINFNIGGYNYGYIEGAGWVTGSNTIYTGSGGCEGDGTFGGSSASVWGYSGYFTDLYVDKSYITTADPELNVMSATNWTKVLILDTDVPFDKKGCSTFFDGKSTIAWNSITGDWWYGSACYDTDVDVTEKSIFNFVVTETKKMFGVAVPDGNVKSQGYIKKDLGYRLNYTTRDYYKIVTSEDKDGKAINTTISATKLEAVTTAR